MKDFKSYRPEEGRGGAQGGERNGGAEENGQNGEQTPLRDGEAQQAVNMAEMLAKAFQGKSEGQIWQTILAQAEQGKRDGTLTNADLDNFYHALSPLLDGFKKQKLKQIIQKLKSI